MILAEPGWRVVVADTETESALYLPIVAWDVARTPPGPPPGFHSTDHDHLDPFFVEPYAGASIVRLSGYAFRDLALGFLSPREEPDGAWDEQAREALEARRSR